MNENTINKLEEIKSTLKWSEKVEGNEYAHKALSQEDILWLINEVEEQRIDTLMYREYLDREKDTNWLLRKRNKRYEEALNKIVKMGETGGNWLEPAKAALEKN
jgi:hypothetical protein